MIRIRSLFLLAAVGVFSGDARLAAQWSGFVDRSTELQTQSYPFFGFNDEAGGNENYYDGDLGDFDGDGLADRLLGARYGLLFNTGGGHMVPIRRYVGHLLRGDPGAGAWGEDAMAMIDVDGDGDLDAISGGNGERLSCQLNEGWRWRTLWSDGGHSALNIVPTDLERDGDVDLLIAHSFCVNHNCGGPVSFSVLRNDGSGNYTDWTAGSGLARLPGQFVIGVVSADIDGDGDFDVLSSRGGSPAGLHVGINNGNGVFTTSLQNVTISNSGFSQNMAMGDIDDDGDIDLVIGRGPFSSDGHGGVYPGGHPTVAHVLALNDGTGRFTDRSASLFDSSEYSGTELSGSNTLLLDADYDGDLDMLTYRPRQDEAGSFDQYLSIFLNDGSGRMRYSAGRSMQWPGRAKGLGADIDTSDLDGDGSYDLWLGAGNDFVRIVMNTYRDPAGLPADMPRNVRVVSEDADAITIGWPNLAFASNARRYNVYRSLAPGVDDGDRELVRVVGRSRHLDQDFFGTIDRHTTTEHLNDPDASIAPGGEIRFRDRNVVPGVTYYYSVSHVGPENDEGAQSAEVRAVAPRTPAADTLSPEVRIVSPTAQDWGRSPRIVVAFGDDESGIDPASLEVSFDSPLGPIAAGTNIASMGYRRDSTTFVAWLAPPHELPNGAVTLTARIRDRAGNEASTSARFAVGISPAIIPSPRLPTASFTASTTSGSAPLTIDFDATASTDPDGHVMRWEWYWGDGSTDIGRQVSHRFPFGGTYNVVLVVRDNEGGVATSSQTITLDGMAPPGDAGVGFDGGPGMDGGASDAMSSMDARVCIPDCDGRTCGDDGCDALCGVCESGRVCGAGVCACEGGAVACGDTCVDVRNDPSNCGECARECATGETCSAGRCGTGPCQADCDGRSCGGDGCGGVCGECAPGQVCATGGMCLCEGGEVGCGEECTDVRTDPNHCGGCGVVCDSSRCVAGACVSDAPPTPNDGGCGCALVGDAHSPSPAFVFLLMAAALRRRRSR